MIRSIHIAAIRELVEQTERDLAGYRYLLGVAEQAERAGTVIPDPLTPAEHQPWTGLAAGWRLPDVAGGGQAARGADPYPASNGTPVFDGTLPPKQESALGTIASEHDAYAQSPKGQDEQRKWEGP
ncbi:hypothetical protein FXF51_56930 [Nonomuraea sp. PA05]|uniref:hypothetical protein n=1 Tax=Nonomuraea sp. PA05 TaxID=2604466 RepID=UPI0011DA9B30|nr:hypothetical protein [Nonomuraea sp. PA05]TYB50266.1 hypothetical protein FXF51_56930 [Nonomuraea sp. PA05]